MSNNIAIINYNMGNLRSVQKKAEKFSDNVIITADPKEIEAADKIILPGVGHFAKAMENLKALNLIEVLNKVVLEDKKPILGICLGMQIMCKTSEEGNANGFGWIDAEVKKFEMNDTLKFKVPHTGWNTLEPLKEHAILKNLELTPEMYFVHAYFVKCSNTEDVLFRTNYESQFDSAFQKENIFGMQFHPEKSHEQGELLIKNFIEL